MKVLVTSRFAVEVVDLDTGETELIRTTGYDSLYYGATWYKTLMFLGKRTLGPDNISFIEILDSNLEYVDTLGYRSFHDVHQIAVNDDKLWMTSSGNNSIIIVDPLTMQLEDVWYPLGNEHRGDKYHINSITVRGLNLLLVAHNFGASQVYQFSYPDRELQYYWNMGMGAHNVYKYGQTQVCTLSSGDGFAISNEGKIYNLYRNNYPRGLAVGHYSTIVGLSEHVNDRGDRLKERRGAVQVYQKGTGSPFGGTHLKTIELGHGMVFEVRGLDFRDFAHEGIVWRGKHGVQTG